MCETGRDPEKTLDKLFPRLCYKQLPNASSELSLNLNMCVTLCFPPGQWLALAACFLL